MNLDKLESLQLKLLAMAEDAEKANDIDKLLRLVPAVKMLSEAASAGADAVTPAKPGGQEKFAPPVNKHKGLSQ